MSETYPRVSYPWQYYAGTGCGCPTSSATTGTGTAAMGARPRASWSRAGCAPGQMHRASVSLVETELGRSGFVDTRLPPCPSFSSHHIPECGITTAAANQQASCETAVDARAAWLDVHGGALTSTTPTCNPATWAPSVVVNQTGASDNCRKWMYKFNVSFAPGGTAATMASFESTVRCVFSNVQACLID